MWIFLYSISFNSRTREGCDFYAFAGADKLYWFQFTHPGRVRPLPAKQSEVSLQFQFTHPGRVRLIDLWQSLLKPPVSIHAPGKGATSRQAQWSCRQESFNSRTREGCDAKAETAQKMVDVSIHAPGKGATTKPHISVFSIGFQFTHPGRVRPKDSAFYSLSKDVSIHAPGKGATQPILFLPL